MKDYSTKPSFSSRPWFEVCDAASIASPALLVYRHRVAENLNRMLAIAGGPRRLRPHIKTHKMSELLQLQLSLGITKFKCATLAEAEMAARAGITDLLLAYQPVGPSAEGTGRLARAFPGTKFAVLCDDADAMSGLSKALCDQPKVEVEALLDVDVGQHRTGVPADSKAVELYKMLAALPRLKPGGLHAYDGHIGDPDLSQRIATCESAFAPVWTLKRQLLEAGLPVPRVVAGGTPTFPIHARRDNVECSPGTCVFWDAGYALKLPDLPFLPAALVLTRVISKPGRNRLCLDLGHKAVAAEMPPPRVQFLNLEDARAVLHSEEHLVVETQRGSEFKLGDCVYGVPWHICPTVALHSEAVVIEDGRVAGRWQVARDRRLTL